MRAADFLENINMMVLASIIAAVILSFILVVIIFSVLLRSQQEKNREAKALTMEQAEKISLLEESLNEVRVLNASQLQELGQQDAIKSALRDELAILEGKLKRAHEKIERGSAEIMLLEKTKSEQGANLRNAKESIVKLEESLANATKRNEFWVEQMAEVRTKYEALRLKVK